MERVKKYREVFFFKYQIQSKSGGEKNRKLDSPSVSFYKYNLLSGAWVFFDRVS